MDTNVKQALITQINAEIYSAHIYRAMSIDFAVNGFFGFAHWFACQSKEEQKHADTFVNFCIARQTKPLLGAVKEPPNTWPSVIDTVRAAYDHEKFITDHINALFRVAVESHDYATQNIAARFIDEQVEEEKTVYDILHRVTLSEGDKSAMLTLDSHLMSRHNPCSK